MNTHCSHTDFLFEPLSGGEHLLCARLHTADPGEAHGALDELVRIITQIRTAWPQVRILVRGDICTAPAWLSCCCRRCGVWGWRAQSWPARNAGRCGYGC
jgi:hypothetical protein